MSTLNILYSLLPVHQPIALEVGPEKDVLTELYNASVRGDLPFGIYYSQGEWFDDAYTPWHI